MMRDGNGLLAYAIFYSLSMTIHVLLAIWLCHRRGFRLISGIALGLCYVWSMNTGARIVYDVLNNRFEWINYFDPGYYLEPGMWGGPLVYLGIALIGSLLWARDYRGMLDVVTLTLPAPMILAKVACFVNGCCHGKPSSLPWAVTFPSGGTERTAPAGVPLHPTQLYEILVLVVVLAVLIALNGKRWKGTLLAWFVMLYCLGRPVTEFFRVPKEFDSGLGPLSLAQTICFSAALAAGIFLIVQQRADNRFLV